MGALVDFCDLEEPEDDALDLMDGNEFPLVVVTLRRRSVSSFGSCDAYAFFDTRQITKRYTKVLVVYRNGVFMMRQ